MTRKEAGAAAAARPTAKAKVKAKANAKVVAGSGALAATAPVLPTMRAARRGPGVLMRVLGCAAFWISVLADIRSAAASVVAATMVNDSPRMQEALLEAKDTGLSVALFVDNGKLPFVSCRPPTLQH